ncbi:MAG: hypothetical protein HWN65_05295 [Candidatus Helarchaeota archaeon]|nr:hypothetical protein [Candidatus Helarchaeota archaeon]
MDYIPLDRDFIQTIEDFFFCVIGYVHPPNWIISYLKYVPSDSGKWKYGDQGLKRMLPHYSAQAVINTFQFLEKDYPQYLFKDSYSDVVFSAVPLKFIKQFYSTQQKLKEISMSANLDPLQEKLKNLVTTLSKHAGVSLDAFGVTGSILLDIHNPDFSDLDITVHGKENSSKLRRTMKNIFEKGHPNLLPLNEIEAERWQKDKSERFGMSRDDAAELFKRKWNMGMFRDTRFSIHPIRNPEEIDEKYGDKTFVRKGQIEIQAKLKDSEALFLPAKFEISDVDILNGENVENIREIISYEGLFDAAVEEGEKVKAKGELELVINNINGKQHYQIVIGSKAGRLGEYILKI